MEKLFRKENNAALRWLVEKTGRSGVYILLLIPLQAMLSASFVLFPLLLKELVDYDLAACQIPIQIQKRRSSTK